MSETTSWWYEMAKAKPGASHAGRRQLVAGLFTALAVSTPCGNAIGITRNVLSCADDGSASTLRSVITASASTDVVNLSTVPVGCSTITLQTGEIVVPQDALYIAGPNDRPLTISANGASRLFNMTSTTAQVTIGYLTMRDGVSYSFSGYATGGCIRSSGSVFVQFSTLTGCAAGVGGASGYAAARGGAIYASNTATLNQSNVIASTAYAYNSAVAAGGGVWAGNVVLHQWSSISQNVASAGIAGHSAGGGFYAQTTATVSYSTVDGNRAGYGGGGYIRGVHSASYGNPPGSSLISQSTISGNIAMKKFGGFALANGLAVVNPQELKLRCSTIAFNAAPTFPGLFARGPVDSISSILARNSNGSADFADIYISGNYALSGSTNLIVSSNQSPNGVIVSTADPQLSPLALHGGRGMARTHALLATSPAVNQGNAYGYFFDQRGLGFDRTIGSSGDIGAYERQINDDELFFSGFD